MDDLRDKKVLVFGLGILGGGVATTNWLLRQGAYVTVADLKNETELRRALKRIKGNVALQLGGHRVEDILKNEVIVLNPDVSLNHELVQLAFKQKKQIENEGTLFFKHCSQPIIGITGTRGKTTTTTWTTYFLRGSFKAVQAGNSITAPFMGVIDRANKAEIVVTELSSFIFELFSTSLRSPEIAVIMNLYRDHIPRHCTMEAYALAKANIFRNQTSDQLLILNYDNEWTKWFIDQKPKSRLQFFSLRPFPSSVTGVYYDKGKVYYQENSIQREVLAVPDFITAYGEHNLGNLLASILAAHGAGVSWNHIRDRISNLPRVPFRQEIIWENERLMVVNDTTSTSPEAGIAAVEKFGGDNCILITGGTDRDLDFTKWGDRVGTLISPDNLIFLAGSATKRMIGSLPLQLKQLPIYDTLADCVKAAFSRAREYSKAVILFSPASKSFEKFKNEYDRGRKFNMIVKRILKHGSHT